MSVIADILSQIVTQTLGETRKITPRELQIAAQRLAKDRRSPETAALATFCRFFHLAYQNFNYDIRSNGEGWLLQRLIPFRPQVIFDVGANVGDWSLLAHHSHPTASIHAFEIIPRTYEKLIRRVSTKQEWFHPNSFGLGAAAGEMMMNYFAGADAVSTHTNYPHGVGEKIVCKVQAGDEYVESGGLPRVDLLKIDAEGAEPLILQGFQKSLGRGVIDLVQFEYGKVSIVTHYLLADYYRFFESQGFVLGKLLPDGVAFRPYSLDDEDFIGPNFVACRRTRKDLIDALRCN